MILVGRGFMMQRQAGSAVLNGAAIGAGVLLILAALFLFVRGPGSESPGRSEAG